MANDQKRRRHSNQDDAQMRQMDSEGGRQNQGEGSKPQIDSAGGSQRGNEVRSSQRSDRNVDEAMHDPSTTSRAKSKESGSSGESCGCGS